MSGKGDNNNGNGNNIYQDPTGDDCTGTGEEEGDDEKDDEIIVTALAKLKSSSAGGGSLLPQSSIDKLLITVRDSYLKTSRSHGHGLMMNEFLSLAIRHLPPVEERVTKFISSFIDIHKKLLTEHNCLESIPLAEHLLSTTKHLSLDSFSSYHRNSTYVYLWNYMCANYKKLAFSQSQSLIRSSLGFSLTAGLVYFGHIPPKLDQCLILIPKPKAAAAATEGRRQKKANYFLRADVDQVKATIEVLSSCLPQVFTMESASTTVTTTALFTTNYIAFMYSTTCTLLQVRVYEAAMTNVNTLALHYTKVTKSSSTKLMLALAKSAGLLLVQSCKFLHMDLNQEEVVEYMDSFRHFIHQTTTGTTASAKVSHEHKNIIIQAFLHAVTTGIITPNHPLGGCSTTKEIIHQVSFETFIDYCLNLIGRLGGPTTTTTTTTKRKMKATNSKVTEKQNNNSNNNNVDQFRLECITAILSLLADRIKLGHVKSSNSSISRLIHNIINVGTSILLLKETAAKVIGKTIHLNFAIAIAQICYNFHAQHDYDGILEFGSIATSNYPDWVSCTLDEKFKLTSHAMLVADSYYNTKRYEETLEWLSFCLYSYPELLLYKSEPAFDSFSLLSTNDWSWAWLRARKELRDSKYSECTVVQICKFKFKDPVVLVLRKELNSYFRGKPILPEEIITVGEALEDASIHYSDKALGMLAQGIGYSWGDEGQEEDAVTLVTNALACLDDGVGRNEKEELVNPIVNLLHALCNIWLGFCQLRINHNRTERDFKFGSELDKKTWPDKYSSLSANNNNNNNNINNNNNANNNGGGADGDVGNNHPGLSSSSGSSSPSRIVPVITSHTIHDEEYIMELFGSAITTLFAFVQLSEKDATKLINQLGPAILIVSVRLLAHRVSAFGGDPVGSIKAWYITFMLSKWYNLKRLIILSGSELLKLIPNLTGPILNTFEETYTHVLHHWPDNNLAKSHVLRLDLAKSAACFKRHDYKLGLAYLQKIIHFRLHSGQIDSISHVLNEGFLLLAQYKSIELSHGLTIDFGAEHENLCRLSPAGLAAKACRSMCGLIRNSELRIGGWQDLFHNAHVLQSVLECSPICLHLIKKTGKCREARILGADYIYVAQQFTCITRTLQALIPIIEIELQMRSFETVQGKIECGLKLLDSYKKETTMTAAEGGKEESNKDKYSSKPNNINVHQQLKSLGINSSQENYKKIVYEWSLPEVYLPAHHYGSSGSAHVNKSTAESPTSVPAPSTDYDTDWLSLQTIQFPSFLLHTLDCGCYYCSNPLLISLTLQFLAAQARYAISAKRPRVALSLMYSARFYLVRAMARSTSGTLSLESSMTPVLDSAGLKSMITSIHGKLYYETGLGWLTTFMELSPYQDIERVIVFYHLATQGIKLYDSADRLSPLIPLELLISALYCYMNWKKLFVPKRSEERESLLQIVKAASPYYATPPHLAKSNNKNKNCGGNGGDDEVKEVSSSASGGNVNNNNNSCTSGGSGGEQEILPGTPPVSSVPVIPTTPKRKRRPRRKD